MIKRIYARISIVSLLLGIVFLLLCGLLTPFPPIYPSISACLGIVLCVVALYIKFFLLRCPSCNRGGTIPQWTKSRDYYCPNCGKPFIYDK